MMNLNCLMVLILFQIFKIIKKHETLTTNPPIHIYINKINRSEFEIKDGYELELQTP